LLQGTAPVRLQQQLGAETTGAALHGSRDRPPCLDPLNAGCFDLFTQRFKETQRQFFIGGLGTQQGEAGGGRQPRGLPLLQCGMGKCRVALPDQQLQQGMVRVARLDEHQPRPVMAPGASGNIPTEDVVYLFDRMGVRTGIDLEKLMAASDLAASLPGALAASHVRAMPRETALSLARAA